MADRWQRQIARLALGLGLGGGLGLAAAGDCRAQGPAADHAAAAHPLDRALDVTINTGRPTVVVVTSAATPDSQRLLVGLQGASEYHDLIRSGQLVALSVEANLARARLMGVSTTPTVVVYRKGARGLELAGQTVRPRDAAALSGWLAGLGVMPAAVAATNAGPAPAPFDPALVRAGLFHHQVGAASPQSTPQAPPAAPPVMAPPQVPVAAPPQQAVLAPIVTGPAPAPVVVSPPSAPVVFQPQAPTVVIGPQPAPNIVFAPSAPATPNITVMAPAAPPANVFMAPAAAPVAAAPMMAQPMQMAPVQQQSPVGQAVVGLMLENPGLIREILGALGRFLSRFSNPRVSMSPSVPQMTQMMLAPAAAPAAPPQQPVYVAQPLQEAPMPSPQSPKKHSWFHRN